MIMMGMMNKISIKNKNVELNTIFNNQNFVNLDVDKYEVILRKNRYE